ncbi:major facilitator superfamily domain-containing protein [Cantharellus anzutake]|uniref:major facilitator superfamily domain-containing protein n=1 Tax=Cantharellus anzutake TaxID=1750568 RepID=UPI001904386B|nr:major facilitator superfamily domain-containing protein [Cantharellus anzutake]KAF8333023.1 major facilitator superfamily domain-containing protein [Cantharellus anzutake]
MDRPLLQDQHCDTSRKVPKQIPLIRYLVPFIVATSIARGVTIGPRVEVYTKVACEKQQEDSNALAFASMITPSQGPISTSIASHPMASISYFQVTQQSHLEQSQDCISDAAVRARAATMQAVALTAGGIMSILTSGLWGIYGDEHGRTRVMTTLIIGFWIGDLMFALASSTGSSVSPLTKSVLLVSGAAVEGLMGSWATFFAVMNAYISDCTEPETRATFFSRFQGLHFVGNSLGPAIGSVVLRVFRIPGPARVPTIFYLALATNMINLLYVLLILPESVSSEDQDFARKQRAKVERRQAVTSEIADTLLIPKRLFWKLKRQLREVLAPLAVLLPRRNDYLDMNGSESYLNFGSKPYASIWRWDFDLTFIGLAFWCNFLNMGVYPNKYLYVEHIFNWKTEKIGYYVTVSSALRSLWLVVFLPTIIQFLKPELPGPPTQPEPVSSRTGAAAVAARRRTYLLPTIYFDLRVAKLSLLMDVMSFTLTSIISSEISFIVTSLLSCFGGGMAPATQSVALALVDYGTGEYQQISEDQEGQEIQWGTEVVAPGQFFGAIGVLQALGQTVLGPLIIGELYALTAGFFPRMIFVAGAILLSCAFIFLSMVRPAKIRPHALDVPVNRRQ